MTKKIKNKEIELPMEYNPGFHKYEPVLPTRNTNKRLKVKVDWKWIILIALSVLVIITSGILLTNLIK